MQIELRYVQEGDHVQRLLERGGVAGISAPEDGVIVHAEYGRRVYIPRSKIDEILKYKGTLVFDHGDI